MVARGKKRREAGNKKIKGRGSVQEREKKEGEIPMGTVTMFNVQW